MKGRGALRIADVRPSVCHRTKHWPKRSINVAACEIRRVVTRLWRHSVATSGRLRYGPLKGPAHLVFFWRPRRRGF